MGRARRCSCYQQRYSTLSLPSASDIFQDFRKMEDAPMGFNYAKERREFEAEWKKLRQQYREAGFLEDKIDLMYDFDDEAFRKRRGYVNHNQFLPPEDFGGDGEQRTSLFGKFECLAAAPDEGAFTSRSNWVDGLSDPALTYRLKLLKQTDLELLTLFVIEGYSQTEIARLQGCSQKNISLKITRIKNFLKNF